MSATLLHESNPVARKRYWCSLCQTSIQPGTHYKRSTMIYDGQIYDWRECPPCVDDKIAAKVDDWSYSVDGIGPETAYEWATEMAIHGSPEDQRAAKDYLARADA